MTEWETVTDFELPAADLCCRVMRVGKRKHFQFGPCKECQDALDGPEGIPPHLERLASRGIVTLTTIEVPKEWADLSPEEIVARHMAAQGEGS